MCVYRCCLLSSLRSKLLLLISALYIYICLWSVNQRYIYIEVAIDFYWLQWRGGLATFIFASARRKFWGSMISGDLAGLIIKVGRPVENWKHERAGLAGFLRSRAKRAGRSCSHNLHYVYPVAFAAAWRLGGSDLAEFAAPEQSARLVQTRGGFAVAPQSPQIDYFPRKIPHKIFSKIPKHFGPLRAIGDNVCDAIASI